MSAINPEKLKELQLLAAQIRKREIEIIYKAKDFCF